MGYRSRSRKLFAQGRGSGGKEDNIQGREGAESPTGIGRKALVGSPHAENWELGKHPEGDPLRAIPQAGNSSGFSDDVWARERTGTQTQTLTRRPISREFVTCGSAVKNGTRQYKVKVCHNPRYSASPLVRYVRSIVTQVLTLPGWEGVELATALAALMASSESIKYLY